MWLASAKGDMGNDGSSSEFSFPTKSNYTRKTSAKTVPKIGIRTHEIQVKRTVFPAKEISNMPYKLFTIKPCSHITKFKPIFLLQNISSLFSLALCQW